MAERKSDHWISVLQSVLLHGAVVGLLTYGWWAWRQQVQKPVAQTLAIEATAIQGEAAKAPKAPAPTPPPQPTPPPPEPEPETGPPTPTPEEIAEREKAEHEAEEQHKQQEQKAEAEKRAVAEQKRLEDLKRKADEKKKLEEARMRAQREAELRKSLEQEERVMAARSSGALASWQAQIIAAIMHAWKKPPSAKPGVDCMVSVSQIRGGTVVSVSIGACNGDQAVRESIQDAVYRASPLPSPPDPALFEANLEIRFRPVE